MLVQSGIPNILIPAQGGPEAIRIRFSVVCTYVVACPSLFLLLYAGTPPASGAGAVVISYAGEPCAFPSALLCACDFVPVRCSNSAVVRMWSCALADAGWL